MYPLLSFSSRLDNIFLSSVASLFLPTVRLESYIALSSRLLYFTRFAHNVAVVVCPLGPRQLSFVGRDDKATSDNTGLLPDTRASASSLIELFAKKTFTVIDLISLIGAHTTAKQRFVDTSKAGQPLDSTPGVWDVAFYTETWAPTSPEGVFRLQSDDAFAKFNQSTRGFTVFSDPATGQATWNALYAKAYTRLSLWGVNKINQLTDCTKVMPDAILVVPPPVSSSSSSSVSASSTLSSASSSSTVSVSTTSSSSSATSHSHLSSSVPLTTSTICITETYIDPIATKTFTVTFGSNTKTITTSFPVKPSSIEKTSSVASASSTPYAPVKNASSHTPGSPVTLIQMSTALESACPVMPTVTATKIV
ncbi:heme peroxidase [Venturia nashicola]|uniref:Peroxidase n=1 Tax=Venturia nashicola TaxID=86259 RepID=A0A4Z1PHA0_9PEZI|nr:heme peroxidase [Venturia nashicola]